MHGRAFLGRVVVQSLRPSTTSHIHLLPYTISRPLLFGSSSSSTKRRHQSTMGGKQDAHQYQAGDSTHRKEDEWKHREPYRIHDSAEDFDVKWEGECHCGKVQYQLSREKPLAAKYCHCTTCQRLHGVSRVATDEPSRD